MHHRGGGLLGAIILGLAIMWVDSSPGWDDTGIIAEVILLTCALFAGVSPARAWHWALAVGVWIPLHGLFGTHNYGSLLALVPAFLGAYLGAGIRWIMFPPPGHT